MQFKFAITARRAKYALRAATALSAVALLGFAAPATVGRLGVQQTNADWHARAESFVETFALDSETARENGFRVGDAREERIWRLARAYDSAENLDAIERDRDAIGVYQTFAAAHFDQAQRQAQERKCLAQTIYYEARSESRQGQMAVAEVVLNRVRHPLYPDTICDVVFQGAERNTGCQFTFTCDGSMGRAPRGWAWASANRLAAHAMLGYEDGVKTGGATHYHANYVDPYWSHTLVRTGKVGTHVFYRFPGAAGRLPEPVQTASNDTPA